MREVEATGRSSTSIDVGAFEAALHGAPLAAAVVDEGGRVRTWNARAEQVTGWTADRVIGGLDPSIPPDEREGVPRLIERLLSRPETVKRVVVDRLRPDGSSFSVTLLAIDPVPLPDGPGLVIWFDEATDADAGLRARNRLASRLTAAQHVDEVLPVLAEAVREVLGGDSAVVLTPCPEREHLHGTQAIGVLQESAEAIELPLGDPTTPWSQALDGEVVVGHLSVQGRRRPTWFVPMGEVADRWVLAVQGDGERSPTLLGREMATGLADEAWIALQRAALVKELADKIEILEATSRLAQVVGLDLGAVVAQVTAHAAAVLSCERAALYVPSEDGGLRLAHVHATDAAAEALVAEDEGIALARRAAEAPERILHQQDEHAPDAAGPWHRSAGAVAVMGLPLRIGARTVGVLVVAHTTAHPRGFTSLCQQVGDAVAHQAAMAVEHARLFADERDTVERLRELDRLKADWIAGITHDLRTPMTGLLGFVHTLQRLADDVSSEQRASFLDAMERQARRLVHLVEDLLLAAQVEGGQIAMRHDVVEVGPLVTAAIAVLGEQERGAVEVDVVGTPTVHGDASHLERIVQNLLDNAHKHGAAPVRVAVGERDGSVLVRVCDAGPGVAAEDRQRIFERFAHGDSPGSTGLGLFVGRGIARAHGGDLRIDPDVPAGACFELELPGS